ncbi:MAG: SDR family oxidoreductase [Limnobacter sp.]|nr:SDR family oxidoreductase [Limnobacter sp.]
MKPTYNNAFLTGACGGLGQALARELLARGANVALVGLNAQALNDLHAIAPQRTAVYTPDVTDSNSMQTCAEDWITSFGMPDLVIANAGVAGGFDTEYAEDLAVMRRMLEINVLGVATTFQPFVAGMKKQKRGALVGIASIAGWRGMPGNGAYCASKGALIRYMESLRSEMRGTGVRAHTVSPGYLKTQLTAGNQFAMPGLMEADEAARALLKGLENGTEHIVLPRHVGWLSRLLGLLPAALHDQILLKQPRKPRAGMAGSTPIPGLDAEQIKSNK